jgi:dTDP-4-dehydrorhamnose 3,5-epimerase
MEFIQSDLTGVFLIKPQVFKDHRGFFVESYSFKKFSDAGINCTFVQDNHSKSVNIGVLRGLHFQLPPFTQSKLIRVTKGAVLDVVVDIRKSSPTFGQWRSFELTEDNFDMLFVPQGFAHGFCTLKSDTEVHYKVDNYYAPEHDRGILWNDPALAIPWPVREPVLSPKDSALPLLKDCDSPFL